MPLSLLEQQKNEADARQLIELGIEIAVAKSSLLKTRAALKSLAVSLMSGEQSRLEISQQISAIIVAIGTLMNAPTTNTGWGCWWSDDPQNPNFKFSQSLDPDFKDLMKRLAYVASEFSTQNKSVSKMYKVGSLGHGILHAIAAAPSRHSELIAFFPTIDGASTLTHMRRQGVIAKETENQQAPFILTELGKEVLQERGDYTFAMWKKYRGTPGATRDRKSVV
jgi:hypothetical protein